MSVFQWIDRLSPAQHAQFTQIGLGAVIGCLLGYCVVRFFVLRVQVALLTERNAFLQEAYRRESRAVTSLVAELNRYTSQLVVLAEDLSRFCSMVKITPPSIPDRPRTAQQGADPASNLDQSPLAPISPSLSSGTGSPISSTPSDSALSKSPAIKPGRYFDDRKPIEWRHCLSCNSEYAVGPGYRRIDSVFCSDACKSYDYRHRNSAV